MVGRSGASGLRFAVETASPVTAPALTCGSVVEMSAKKSWMLPERTSVTACGFER
jgi:hypothetical protein